MWTNTFRNDYVSKYPHYKYILWDEEKIKTEKLFKNFKLYEQIYNIERTWNGKSDILRYIILYEYGGIYIDADSVWLNDKNFDVLISKVKKNNHTAFVSTHVENDIICGGVMGSTKNNSIMKELIINIENHTIQHKKNNEIDLNLYTRKIKNHGVSQIIGPRYLNNNLKNAEITIFPSKYFYPISWHRINDTNIHKNITISDEAYTFQYGYTTNNLHLLII
jgi:mannosyltransferase OCH1-like enzyme